MCDREDINILVIDDCEDNLLLLKLLLESVGYNAQLACNGQDGLNQISLHVPDLIILDLMMPDITGLELIEILKADSCLSLIPILLCTANKYLSEYEIAQATNVCYKPFEIDDLLAKVDQMLSCCKNEGGKMTMTSVDDEETMHFESRHLLRSSLPILPLHSLLFI